MKIFASKSLSEFFHKFQIVNFQIKNFKEIVIGIVEKNKYSKKKVLYW